MNNPECDYSFEMLYHAAFGKSLPRKKKQSLKFLNQEDINKIVTDWAGKAGWNTKEKKGSDGKIYTAFFPAGQGAR